MYSIEVLSVILKKQTRSSLLFWLILCQIFLVNAKFPCIEFHLSFICIIDDRISSQNFAWAKCSCQVNWLVWKILLCRKFHFKFAWFSVKRVYVLERIFFFFFLYCFHLITSLLCLIKLKNSHPNCKKWERATYSIWEKTIIASIPSPSQITIPCERRSTKHSQLPLFIMDWVIGASSKTFKCSSSIISLDLWLVSQLAESALGRERVSAANC